MSNNNSRSLHPFMDEIIKMEAAVRAHRERFGSPLTAYLIKRRAKRQALRRAFPIGESE